MTPGSLRHAQTAAENTRLRAQLAAAHEDIALLLLRLHLAPWVVQVDPAPRRRARAARHAEVPSPRPPSSGS